jgi:hypothetical protein
MGLGSRSKRTSDPQHWKNLNTVNQCCESGSGGSIINWSPGYRSLICITDPDSVTDTAYLSRLKEIPYFITFNGLNFTNYLTTFCFQLPQKYPGAVINWPPGSGLLIQDCRVADPEERFTDL